jgi:HSP90 family molecular chaperone
MKNQRTILIIVVLFLVIGNIFFFLKYSSAKKQLAQTQSALSTQQTNGNILSFTDLFIEKVLKADSEVDFETRLELENAVRNLNDSDVLAQWQKFTNAQTQEEAQKEVKNLLEMLVGKVR